MVDATDLKSVVLSGVGVRVPPRAPLLVFPVCVIVVACCGFCMKIVFCLLLSLVYWHAAANVDNIPVDIVYLVKTESNYNDSKLESKLSKIFKNIKVVNVNCRNISTEIKETQNRCSGSEIHKNIWADIVKNKYKNSIVLNDNVILENDFVSKLKLLIQNIPCDYDVFLLDIGVKKPTEEKTYYVSPKYWLSCFKNTRSKFYAIPKTTNKIFGLHAYCVSLEGAKKMLPIIKNTDNQIDKTILCNKNNLKKYVSKIKLLSVNEASYNIKTEKQR